MDNRGKGSPTKEERVEKNYSRPTESKPTHSDPIKKIRGDTDDGINGILKK